MAGWKDALPPAETTRMVIQASDGLCPANSLASNEFEHGCTRWYLVGSGTLHKSLNDAPSLLQVIARSKHILGQVYPGRPRWLAAKKPMVPGKGFLE